MIEEAMDRHISHLGEVFPSLTVIEMARSDSVGRNFLAKTKSVLGRRYYGGRRPSGHWAAVAAGMTVVSRTVLAVIDRRDAGLLWADLSGLAAPDPCPMTVVGFDPSTFDDDSGPDDLAMMSEIGGAEVYAPADAEEARQVLWHGVTRRGFSYVRLPSGPTPPVVAFSSRFNPGEWPILREGGDVTLIVHGRMVAPALEAATALAAEGIESAVWNASSIRPLDERKIAEAAKRSRRLVVIEAAGGLGRSVAAAMSRAGVMSIVISLATDEAEEIVKRVRAQVKRRG